MEHSMNNFQGPEKNPDAIVGIDRNIPEAIEYVSEFEHHREDLSNLFNIEVTSEASLSYPWVKDEMYEKVKEGFDEGNYFTLDYMFEEGLLTKKDLEERGIGTMKERVLNILHTLRGVRLSQAKKLFINAGILTEDDIQR